MHGLSAGLARGLDHALDVEIAVARPRRSEQHGLVGHAPHASRRGRLRNRPRPCAGPWRARCGSRGQAISPRLAISSVRKRRYMSGPIHDHILNRPNFVGSIGALDAADSPSPSTSLVSAGSITPSSQSRAVA